MTLRSVKTSFWSDPFIEDLTPSDKLLFLYLITNEKTNMLGIYEASIKKISFETGIAEQVIKKGLKLFETINKVKYINNHVVLLNFVKNQNYNTNMKKSAIACYNDLPNCLKNNSLVIDKTKPLEGFETITEWLANGSEIEFNLIEYNRIGIEGEVKGMVPNPSPKKIQLGQFENIEIEEGKLEGLKSQYSDEAFNWMIEKLGAYLVGKKKKVKTARSLKAYFVNWVYTAYKEKHESNGDQKGNKGFDEKLSNWGAGLQTELTRGKS